MKIFDGAGGTRVVGCGVFEPVYQQSMDNYSDAMWVFDRGADGYGWPTKTTAGLAVAEG